MMLSRLRLAKFSASTSAASAASARSASSGLLLFRNNKQQAFAGAKRAAGCGFGISSTRGYHTYPDPDEKPVITSHVVDKTKPLAPDPSLPPHTPVVKAGGNFDVMREKFCMTQPFQLPANMHSSPFKEQPLTRTGALPNGLVVASQDMPGLMCSITLLVKTGSSAERQIRSTTTNTTSTTSNYNDETGSVHLTEVLAFHATKNRTHEEIHKAIEKLGGMVQCIAQRESIAFFVDVLRVNLEEAVDILADAVLRPEVHEEEVEDARAALSFMRENMPAEVVSRDAIVMAAYANSPLGNHHFCPPDSIDKLGREHVMAFRNKYFVASNCILAASAVDHDEFMSLAEKKFGAMPSGKHTTNSTTTSSSTSTSTKADPLAVATSTYTGSMIVEQRDFKEEWVKCALGFEIGGLRSPDFVKYCVLQQLMGGGSSFSAGGPGKGMYTRLYREVLNRYGWVESAEAFVNCFNDVGLLGIDGSCRNESITSMIQVFYDQLLRFTIEEVTAEELSRAKSMLQSMLFTQLESRLIVCEDIAKQMMVYGKRTDGRTLAAEIDAVTAADLKRISIKMFANNPSISIIGYDVKGVPSYESIVEYMNTFKSQVWKEYKVKP